MQTKSNKISVERDYKYLKDNTIHRDFLNEFFSKQDQ